MPPALEAREITKRFPGVIACDKVNFDLRRGEIHGLLGMKEKGAMAIGVDVDQYNSYPEVKGALVTSAVKNVAAAVFNYLKSVSNGSVKAGVSIANLKNGGVGLAPFHDWEGRVPQAVREKVAQAAAGLIGGTLATGHKPQF